MKLFLENKEGEYGMVRYYKDDNSNTRLKTAVVKSINRKNLWAECYIWSYTNGWCIVIEKGYNGVTMEEAEQLILKLAQEFLKLEITITYNAQGNRTP